MDCRIVGIGASAGGLDALERFFHAVPRSSGLAYVVVQHLDPARPDLLPELLQRVTKMPVAQATEGAKVEPDHVYVIPPGHDLSIAGGRLVLRRLAASRGARLRIDSFLRALAADEGPRSIGVILSGTGSDGTEGLRAIREHGGVTLVQDPVSAEFDGMPRSVVDAGLADVVAEAGDLPRRIFDLVADRVDATGTKDDPPEDDLADILAILDDRGRGNFSLHKSSSVRRRIERRMAAHQLHRAADYVALLTNDEAEVDLLVKELLIGVTSFFRDPEVWNELREAVIPALLAEHPQGGTVRAWVPGCSTGQEAYSLAMVFREVLEDVDASSRCTVKIFASDLDAEAVDRARRGVYPREVADEVGEQRLRRFFVEDETGYRVGPQVREMVVFAQHDVTVDPPFTKLELVSCRNLLIYFGPDLQARVLARFHYALRPHGVLLLGSAETTTVAEHLYESVSRDNHVYRRSDAAVDAVSAMPMPNVAREQASVHHAAGGPTIGSLVTDLIVREHSPAAVLTNEEGDILYVSRRSGDFLEPAIGTARLNVFSMARDDLGEPLLEAFQTALVDATTTVVRGVPFATEGATTGRVADITVRPLREPEQLRGLVLVVFDEVSAREVADDSSVAATGRDERLASLSRELHSCRERSRVLREEMQSSREELTSANEELQSTNEELSTSREELQSTNEELRTINNELQAKLNELSQTGDDMKNLLDSTDIAILFLDRELRVRRFTVRAARVIRLQQVDVGRHFTDLATDLDYPDLADDATRVIETGLPTKREVAASGDRWFHVGAVPYNTQDGRLEGVVLTFSDVTAMKALELQLRALQVGLEARVADQEVELGDARQQLDERDLGSP